MRRQPRKTKRKRRGKARKKKNKRASEKYAVGSDSSDEASTDVFSSDQSTEEDHYSASAEEEAEDDDTEERYVEESESYPDSETDSDEAIERVLKVPSDKILRPFLFYGIQAPIKIVLSALLSQHRWHVLVRHRLGGALSVLQLSVARTCVLPPLAALLFPLWWWQNVNLRSTWCRILDAPKCRPSNCRLLDMAFWLTPVDIIVSCWIFIQLVVEWASSQDQHMAGGLGRIVVLELLLSGVSSIVGPMLYLRLRRLRREKPGRRQYRLIHMEEGRHGEPWQTAHRTRRRRRKTPSTLSWDGVAPGWSSADAPASTKPQSIGGDASAAFDRDIDTRPSITQVLLRPLEKDMQKVMPHPSEFEMLWSSSFGSSADLHFSTALTPRLHSVCKTLSAHWFHVVAKGKGRYTLPPKRTTRERMI